MHSGFYSLKQPHFCVFSQQGTLVPLPEKVLECVQSESDREIFLARLAVHSGANVRQISGTWKDNKPDSTN